MAAITTTTTATTIVIFPLGRSGQLQRARGYGMTPPAATRHDDSRSAEPSDTRTDQSHHQLTPPFVPCRLPRAAA